MPRTKSTNKPVSEKQLAANRANAAQSTGPRSPEGKARSAQNSRKHGFTATTFAVVRLEELDEVARLREDLIACYQPVNSQVLPAIERIALAQQALLRAARFEVGMFTACLDESFDGAGRPIRLINSQLVKDDMQTTRAQNRNCLPADGFNRVAKASNGWSLFLRCQAQAERLCRRAIEEFERLKALPAQLPNEPIMLFIPKHFTFCAEPNEPNYPRHSSAALFNDPWKSKQLNLWGVCPN